MKTTYCVVSLLLTVALICATLADAAAGKEPKGSGAVKRKAASVPETKAAPVVVPENSKQGDEVVAPVEVPSPVPLKPIETGAASGTTAGCPSLPFDVLGVAAPFTAYVRKIEQAICQHPAAAPYKPHLRNLKNGALSVIYGPLSYFVESARLPQRFWTGAAAGNAKECFADIFAGAKLNALARFEFSVGSFISELFVFQLIAVVVVRRWGAARTLRAAKHSSWATLVLLSAVPNGLIDIAGLVSAAGGVSLSAFVSSSLVGKIAKPYVTVVALWVLRYAASVGPLTTILAPVVTLIQSSPSSASSSSSSSLLSPSVEQVQCVAAVTTLVVLVLSRVLPSTQRDDDIDEADE